MPSDTVVTMTADFVAQSLAKARGMIGEELFTLIDSTEPQEGAIKALVPLVERYVCLEAYAEAIPSLDLVLTPTGFGVVSNQNVAPASADRVERLLARVRHERDDALDALIRELRCQSLWHDTPQARSFFTSLFWLGSQMQHFGIRDASRADLEKYALEISEGEAELRGIISPEMFDALLETMRTGDMNIAHEVLTLRCRVYVAARAAKEDTRRLRREILSMLQTHPDDYPEYFASSTYKATKIERYENRRDDTCYFF